MREYPKMLYKGGEAGPGPTRHERTRIVQSASEEVLANVEGYFGPMGDAGLMRRRFHGADPAKFDHDGDGNVGGSLPGGTRKRPKATTKRN